MAGLKGPHGPLKAGLHSFLLASTSASSPPAATASITSALPSTGTVGAAISFTYTSANVSTLYLAVIRNGAEVSRSALPTTAGTTSYTSAAAGNEQFALYSVASGGAALYTSASIVISAAATPALVLNMILGGVTSGATFTVSGTLSNYTGQPALSVSVDGASPVAMTSASPYLIAFTPSIGAPTGFTFTAQAVSSGNHTIQVTDSTNSLTSNTVSVTAAAPGTVGSLPAFRVQAVNAMPAGAPITLGHFFVKGDLPTGTWTKLIASTTGGQTARVQVDQTNSWLADNSLRFCSLSLLSPIAFAAGQVASFQLGVSTTAFSGAAITTSQILAAGDFSIQVAGGADYGGGVSISGANAPSAGSFSGVNNSTLTVTGGGSAPLVLSQTYQEAEDVACEVEALSGAAQTFTAIVQVGNFVGYAEGGLVLRNSGSGQMATLASFTPNGGSQNIQVNTFSGPTINTAGLGTPLAVPYAAGPLFMRIAYDGTNYTFLLSPSGAANSWTQVVQEPAASVFSPNQIGFYLCANAAGASYSGSATLTVSDWEVTSGATLQGAASAAITTTTVAFAASAQDVLSNFTQSTGIAGWGTNYPLGGWEMIRSGPVCSEFRAWRYLKRASDGASHAQVKAKFYVRAWSDGAGGIQGYEPLAGLFQENSYGPHPSGTVGMTLQAFRIANASVNHGATPAATFGALVTNPQRGWWGALPDGTRPWVGVNGSAKPSYMVAHDQNYINETRCMPPYDPSVVPALVAAGVNVNMQGPAETYTPNASNFSNSLTPPGAINATSDGQNDRRYGYLNVQSAALFLNPFDQMRHVSVLADGWGWADWEFWSCDERTGWPVNTGTDSSTCPSPANPTFEMYGSDARGSPAFWNYVNSPAFPGTYHLFNYGARFDFSHAPSLWIMPYLRTADAAFEEMALFESSAAFSNTDQGGRNFTYNGVPYENVMLGLYQNEAAERAAANIIKQVGATDRMMRDANPMRGFVKRALSQNAAYAGLAPNLQYTPPALMPLGNLFATIKDTCPATNNGDAFPHLFMTGLLGMMVGVEARVGEYPGWQTLLNAMQPILIGLYDGANGSSTYNLTMYWVPMSNDGTTVAYSNMAQLVSAQGLNNTPSTGFRYDNNDPEPGSGDAHTGFETIASIPRAAIYMAGWLDTPITGALRVSQESYARYKATFPGQPGVIPYMDAGNSLTLDLNTGSEKELPSQQLTSTYVALSTTGGGAGLGSGDQAALVSARMLGGSAMRAALNSGPMTPVAGVRRVRC